jgi:hypothetical protein
LECGNLLPLFPAAERLLECSDLLPLFFIFLFPATTVRVWSARARCKKSRFAAQRKAVMNYRTPKWLPPFCYGFCNSLLAVWLLSVGTLLTHAVRSRRTSSVPPSPLAR